MENDNKYILLDIILRNGSIDRLKRNGVSYENISELISILIKDNLIEFKNEKLLLTEIGLNELNK